MANLKKEVHVSLPDIVDTTTAANPNVDDQTVATAIDQNVNNQAVAASIDPPVNGQNTLEHNAPDHIENNDGEQLFKCPHLNCSKSFNLKQNLLRHLAVHRGAKFKCGTCSREFNRKDNLKRHYATCHPPNCIQS